MSDNLRPVEYEALVAENARLRRDLAQMTAIAALIIPPPYRPLVGIPALTVSGWRAGVLRWLLRRSGAWVLVD